MFGNIGPWELGFVLIIVLIIFGPGKLPKLGESVGKALKGFRNAQRDDLDEDRLAEQQSNSKGNL